MSNDKVKNTDEDTALDAIHALKQLNNNIKSLQESLVSQRLPLEQIKQINNLIEQSKAVSISGNTNESRWLKHFNFSAAQANPNEILPFSPVTGEFNPVAPVIDVRYNKQTAVVTASCNLGRCYEGPPNMVHGGTVAAIYDQILAMCGTCNQLAGPTATLTVEYLKPTPLNCELLFSCKILKTEGRKIFIEGECHANDELVSQAHGLFIQYQA